MIKNVTAALATAKAGQAGQVKLRIFLWIVLAWVTGWLLYMGVAPKGKISYVYDFSKSNYFINKLTPVERVDPIKNGSQVVIGDPIYFSLRTSRRFDKGELTIKYKNTSDKPLIEAGVLVDKTIWRYDLRPIENGIIDKLSLVWDVIHEDGLMFLQNNIGTSSEIKKFKGVEEFLNNLPDSNEIALYNYNLDKEFILDDYVASQDEIMINNSIRGSYQFYTYIKDEDLDFRFEFLDINKNKDSDVINLYVYYDNKLISSSGLEDDGIAEDNGKLSERGEFNLGLVNLPEGVYKIEVKVNDDIITKNIKTKQQKLGFINKLWLAEDPPATPKRSDGGRGENKEIKLYTDSRTINAQTINPNSLQKIRVGEYELDINKTFRQFSIKTDSDINEIILEKDDVILSGNRIFSFTEKGLINPEFKKVDGDIDFVDSNVNYILARYEIPKEYEDWKIAKINFDLSNVYREYYPRQLGGAGEYSFLISAPGLKADDEIEDYIEISEIKVSLEGTSLIEKIKKIFKR